MASVGLDTGGSQFYVSLSPSPHMNGRCVVFGRMEPAGEPVLAAIEKVCFKAHYLYSCSTVSHPICAINVIYRCSLSRDCLPLMLLSRSVACYKELQYAAPA